ncbi:hypothetical protein DL95DRAFT_466857 [Leptodontidium sp. 2 PMI_412]|nr:hypothetical protein DL95DRAFT_466857 [Leptodontidium sp. 2 PMI_412]
MYLRPSSRIISLILLISLWLLANEVASSCLGNTASLKQRKDVNGLPEPSNRKTNGARQLIPRVETTTPLVAAQLIDIYNMVPRENQVDTDQFRTYALDGRHSETFSATFCWGCAIVVIAARDRVLIAHIAEETDSGETFDTDSNYNAHAAQPITELIDANRASLGTNPAVMVFARARGMRDAAHWYNQGRLDNLVQTVALRLGIPVNYVVQEAYTTQGPWEDSPDSITGKVTVVWTVPGRTSSDRRAELQIYAEDRRIFRSSYLCDDSRKRCTIS